MKVQHKYCPDFRTCLLEARLMPVVPNLGLGTIALTTGGYVLTKIGEATRNSQTESDRP